MIRDTRAAAAARWTPWRRWLQAGWMVAVGYPPPHARARALSLILSSLGLEMRGLTDEHVAMLILGSGGGGGGGGGGERS